MGSTRFPGKVMRDLGGKPVLAWVVEALRQSPGVDQVVIATSTLENDDVIANWCASNGVDYYRGSESDVLDRFYQCAVEYKADVILRLTCDCPFLDPNVVGQVITLRETTGAAYASNQPTWPDGLDTEVFTFAALQAAWKEATRPTDRDCVTQYIIRNQDRFPAEYLVCPFPGAHKERWVLDTQKDYDLCVEIAKRWTRNTPPSCMDIIRILDREPHLREFNAGAIRNERFYEGLAEEQLPPRTYTRSNELLVRATETIPLGSQTFSKSPLFYPVPGSPAFASHGEGCRIFDVDGNDYIDLVNALLPVVLGYRDPDVDDAVRRQLNRAGMSFSLATRLESELSERLVDLIPCAEMVKFGKTGTDVTTAAVRLARAYTGRHNVLVGGYHGWADWSMGNVRGKDCGIPRQNLSHHCPYGDDIGTAVMAAKVEPAAIIVEPTHNPAYLHWLREFCSENGILLIFDEIQTGFRYSMGGAQKYFGVTPDLACFGKSMANGMPISALVGKRDIMQLMDGEHGVFYSGTFFGDTLSIAAAIATIDKMVRENVIGHLWTKGAELSLIAQDMVEDAGLKDVIKFHGQSCLKKITFHGDENISSASLQGLFTKEMAAMGVLILNAHGVSYSIKEPEVKRITDAYHHTLGIIKKYMEKPWATEAKIKGVGLR